MPSSTSMNRVFTFKRVRGFIFAALGVVVMASGIIERHWLTLIFGAAIIAYGAFAPG
jgi:protein-S-isoprenylcysteine O-methyltransferase Ste14